MDCAGLQNKSKTFCDGEKTMMLYNNMYISLLQIQFSPLRLYAYAPATKSQKIEGKSIYDIFCRKSPQKMVKGHR